MPVPFNLTPQPIRVTSTGFQPLYLAMDISGFDQLDILSGVMTLEGTSSPSVTVAIWTGMQAQTDDGWVTLVSFPSVNQPDKYQKLVVAPALTTGALRYIRWKVTALTGTVPAATFFISGVGRSYQGN
jgi:hypothetical protein